MQGINQVPSHEMIVGNAILTTALLANEVCVQTKGEFILQEEDYIYVVKNFQVALSKKIMPVKTQEELKQEAKKYISELLIQLSSNGEENGESGTNKSESESNGTGNGEND